MEFSTMRLALIAACAALFAASCSRAAEAPAASSPVDPAFGAKVRAYLLQHPEVLEEAYAKLQENKRAAANAKLADVLKKERARIERDPRDYVANPSGKVTVTEFYDYRCPHCVNIAPKVLELIGANPDVRFVFKELPIFGATSERAARAAIAVKRAGKDVLGLHREFMAARPLTDAAIDKALRARELDPAALANADAKAAADQQLADTAALAAEIGIDGTPAFVVGDTLVMGADAELLQAAITQARAEARTGK
jgi:protein-disulfide isomerase